MATVDDVTMRPSCEYTAAGMGIAFTQYHDPAISAIVVRARCEIEGKPHCWDEPVWANIDEKSAIQIAKQDCVEKLASSLHELQKAKG